MQVCPKCGSEMLRSETEDPYCPNCLLEKGLEKPNGSVLPGSVIEHFEVVEKIGRGGMGEVYLARDTKLDRLVALKFLPLELQSDAEARARFLREAKTAAQLNHPFICKIHEMGEFHWDTFISMEYVEGETLESRIAKGSLPIGETVAIAIELADALAEAHERGIVHRDLKPANVMLTQGGHVKVMDFGLAKRVAADDEASQQATLTALTREGSTLGTVPYMSPEQLRGEEVDGRSDIFSFGIILYEMLAGVHPFRKPEAMETAAAILHGELPPLARYRDEVSDLFQHMLRKMLAKDPADRYQLTHEVQTDLKAVSREAAQRGPEGKPRTVPQRLRTSVLLLLGLGLVATVGGLLWERRARQPPAPAIQETAGTEEGVKPQKGAGAEEPEAIRPAETALDKSIAVLPFENRSNREEDRFFTDGIHDELLARISRIGSIKTISRTSVMGYRDTTKNMRMIGEELSVTTILQGGVQFAGDQIRINVQLIETSTDAHLWAERYTRMLTVENVFEIQNEITGAIADALQVALSREEEESLERLPTQNLAALEAYFRGKERYHFRSGTAVRESIVHLEDAISLDPDFAMAHAMLGRSYIRNTYYTDLPFNQEVAKAERHILKALELDDTQSEVHVALGTLRDHQGDLAGKESAYKKAVDLNPNNAAAHASYARVRQRRIGSTLEVARLWRKSYELDPNSQNAQGRLASSLAASGQLDEALKVRESVASRNPGSSRALLHLGRFYFYNLGRFDDAIVTFRKQLALDPKHIAPPSYLANAYGNLGDRERAVRWLEWRLKTIVDPVSRAAWRAPLLRFAGDNSLREEQALEELWASPKNRAFWGILANLIDLYLTSSRVEKARSRLEAAFPSLFDPSAEVDGYNIQQAKDVARVLMATGEREQANHLIAKALPVARLLTPSVVIYYPRLLEASLHAIAGDERQALAAIRRYFEYRRITLHG